MDLQPHSLYKIQFVDSQTLIAKFIREEQLAGEWCARCKFIIGKTITIRVCHSEFTIVEKVANSEG